MGVRIYTICAHIYRYICAAAFIFLPYLQGEKESELHIVCCAGYPKVHNIVGFTYGTDMSMYICVIFYLSSVCAQENYTWI